MNRFTSLLLAAATLATAIAAPAAYGAGRPRDTSVSCVRADNQYCSTHDSAGRSDRTPASPLYPRSVV